MGCGASKEEEEEEEEEERYVLYQNLAARIYLGVFGQYVLLTTLRVSGQHLKPHKDKCRYSQYRSEIHDEEA
jgi:hypothetical protein